MKIIFAISSRYYKINQTIWTTTSYNTFMWDEYLKNFNEIYIFAPVSEVQTLPVGCKRADMPGVIFIDSSGLKSVNILNLIKIKNRIDKFSRNLDAGIIHSPSIEAEIVYSALKKNKKPYVVESRGEQLMNEAFLKAKRVPFPKLIKKVFHKMHLKHLAASYGCIYVSKYLMEAYTPRRKIQKAVISDLRLPNNFVKKEKHYSETSETFRILNVGNLSAYKDQNTLLRALAELLIKKKNVELHIIGKGPLEEKLKFEAQKLKIDNRVFFHGFVPWGEELFKYYDSADLFVLSSLTEGMPRVILESLARGLPVVSTRVSGAIEVLPDDCIVPVGDYKSLSFVIENLMVNRARLNQLSKMGIMLMENYKEELLKQKKINFFRGFVEELKGGDS